MAPGYLRQRLIVLATKKIRTLLPGFGFFYGQRKGLWAQPFGGARPSSVPMASILMRLRRMGREGVSPALRAVASDFSLRGQRKVTKRKANPADSLSCVESPRLRHDADGTCRRAFPGPSSLARHPCLVAWQRAFVSANQRGNQYRARLWLGWLVVGLLAATQRSEWWVSHFSWLAIFFTRSLGSFNMFLPIGLFFNAVFAIKIIYI